MPNLVSIKDAAEVLNTTQGAIMTLVSKYKSENGKVPEWYLVNKKEVHIDMDILNNNNELRKRAWLYATDKLYWILDELEGSFTNVCEYLSKHAGGSVNSWAMYLSRDLFNIPNGNVYELKPCKLFDFVRHGTRYVYDTKGLSSQLQ